MFRNFSIFIIDKLKKFLFEFFGSSKTRKPYYKLANDILLVLDRDKSFNLKLKN